MCTKVMNTSNEITSLVREDDDDGVNELKYLLSQFQTANDVELLNITEASKAQLILKLRKSRWLKIEIEYAHFLIEEFDNGLSPEIKNGHTKRSFLSDKLMCAPMRISKKFPGKSIGKQHFMRRSKDKPLPLDLLRKYAARHCELRIKFLKTVLEAELKTLLESKCPMPEDISKALSSTRKEKVSDNNNPPQQPLPTIMAFPGPISVQANKIVQPGNAIQYHTISTVRGVAPPAPHPNSLHQNHIGQKPVPPPASVPPVFLLHTNFVKSVTSQDKKPKSILSTEQGSKFGSSRADHNDIPDLLSGFDKHAASMLENKKEDVGLLDTSEHPLLAGPIGESPYITSKSFDDLHQFLGTNQIPHLDLNESHATRQKEQSQKMNVPTPSVLAGDVPIQVSTSNCPSTFVPYANQQRHPQPLPANTVSSMPQLNTEMAGQVVPAQQFKTAGAAPMVPKPEDNVTEVLPRKSYGSLTNYNQNRNQSVIDHALPRNPPILNTVGDRVPDKRNHNDAGLSFQTLLNHGCTKRFKSSHAVSTNSEPSSSDGELVPSGNEYSSTSSKPVSKQSSNFSDSSETD